MVSREWKARLLILCMTAGILLCDADGRGTRGRGRRGGDDDGGLAVVGGRSRSDRLLIEKIISRLGDPCTAKCASKRDVRHRRSCETRCRAHKATRLQSILSKIETLSTNSSESNITSTGGADNTTAGGNATAPAAVVARPRRVGCESTMEAAAVCALCPARDDEGSDDTALEIPLPDGLPYLEGTDKERREFGEFLLSPSLGLAQEQTRGNELGKGDKEGDDEVGALYATSRMGAGSLCVAIAKAPNMTSSLSAIGIPVSSNEIPGGVPTEVNAHLGSSNLTALRFLADGDGVEAVWACGDEALNGTLLLSPPLMPIDGAVCSIDARDGGKLRTFEARGQMSIGSTSVSAIAKQEGDGRYGTVTAEFGGGGMQGVAVSDLLDAFGCADKDNVNQTWPWGEGGAGACEIPAGGGGLEDELKIMSIGGQGGGGGVLLAGYDSVGGGAGWYEAKGTPPSSLFDQGCTIRLFADYEGPLPKSGMWGIRTALVLGFDAQAGTTLSNVIARVTRVPPSSLLESLRPVAVSLVLSRGPNPPSRALTVVPSAPQGASLHCTLAFTPGSPIGRVLGRMITFPAGVRVTGIPSSSSFSLRSIDVMSLSISPGSKLLSAKLTVPVGGKGRAALKASFSGSLIVPLSPTEVIRMPGTLEITPPSGRTGGGGEGSIFGASARLQGSLQGTLSSLFGVPDVSLGYAVIDQEVYGTRVARFIMRSVLYIGCTDPQKGATCAIKGASVAGLDPASPEEDMVIAEVDSNVQLSSVYSFIGLPTASQPIKSISGASIARGAHVALALRGHQWLVGDSAETVMIPEGFSGQGELTGLLGYSGATPCVWKGSPLSGGRGDSAAVDCLLHRRAIEGGGLRVVGSTGWSLLKTRRGVSKIQARLGAWGLSGDVVMSVGADGYSFGVAGRVYGGVAFQAKVSSRGGNGGGLFGADWFISGGVTSRGIAEIEERGRATYVRNCRADRRHCNGQLGEAILAGQWLTICSLTVAHSRVPLKQGPVSTIANVVVLGRRRSLRISVDYGDVSMAAEAVASAALQAALHSVKTVLPRGKTPDQCPKRSPLPRAEFLDGEAWGTIWGTVYLPKGAEVTSAFSRDNGHAKERELDNFSWRTSSQPRVASRRFSAVLRLYEARKRAWSYDTPFFSGAKKRTFGEARPKQDMSLEGGETDSWGGGFDGAIGKAIIHGYNGHVFRERLAGISNRLQAIGARLKEKASAEIDQRMERDWGKLVKSIPITPLQEAQVRDAATELKRARAAWAKRVNAMSPRAEFSRQPRGTGLTSSGGGLSSAPGSRGRRIRRRAGKT